MTIILDYNSQPHQFQSVSNADPMEAYRVANQMLNASNGNRDGIEILHSGDGTEFQRYTMDEFYNEWVS